MFVRVLDSWLIRQPLSRKLYSLNALTMGLVAVLVSVQVVAAVAGLSAFKAARDLHARATVSLNLEKDLASLERDVFKAVARPTPATIAAAEGNIGDLNNSIRSADAAAEEEEHHAQLREIRDGAAQYGRLFAQLKPELERRNLAAAAAIAPKLALLGHEMDENIEAMRNDYKAKATAEDAAIVGAALSDLILIAIAGILVIFAARFLTSRIGRSVSNPLTDVTAVLERLAAQDYAVEIQGVDRADEIGALSRAASALRETGLRKSELELRETETLQQAEEQRRAALAATADEFEKTVMDVVNTVAAVAAQIESGSRETDAAAERSRNLSTDVAAAAGQANRNVQEMAVATRQMSQSIVEVSRQVSESSAFAERAVEKAHDTDEIVAGLSESAQKIGEVIGLIQSVAGQTNLLALNATIEAARAGEAGRGFAVVASEIMTLAGQTASATAAITDQISSIQKVSSNAAGAIAHIRSINVELSEILGSVAAAVEEQAVTTEQMSTNTADVAAGTDNVTHNIAAVREGAEATGEAARSGVQAAGELARQANSLKAEVERFLENVRAA